MSQLCSPNPDGSTQPGSSEVGGHHLVGIWAPSMGLGQTQAVHSYCGLLPVGPHHGANHAQISLASWASQWSWSRSLL